jgi:hypothetical protein
VRKALVIFLAVLGGLAQTIFLTWIVLDLPPVRLVREYGFPPAGGPTGRTMEIEGAQFVEIGTGYFRPSPYWRDIAHRGRPCMVWKKRPGNSEELTP